MTKRKYLKDLEDNKLFEDIKRQIILGYMIGFILIFLSLTNILFVIEANHFIWKIVLAIGFIFGFLALIVPQALGFFEKAWTFLAKLIGKIVFSIILTLIYFLIITPIGLFFRRTKESKYFLSWDNKANNKSLSTCKWNPKELDLKIEILNNKRRNILGQFFAIIYFFINNKQWWLIPIIIFLLLLGLILFFVQSSVLAPFIYTLF